MEKRSTKLRLHVFQMVESAGWAMFSRSAARVSEARSTISTKYRSWRRSIILYRKSHRS